MRAVLLPLRGTHCKKKDVQIDIFRRAAHHRLVAGEGGCADADQPTTRIEQSAAGIAAAHRRISLSQQHRVSCHLLFLENILGSITRADFPQKHAIFFWGWQEYVGVSASVLPGRASSLLFSHNRLRSSTSCCSSS